MVDLRIKKMAKILVDYSTKIKKDERVMISGSVEAKDLIKEVYRLVLKKGAYPFLKICLPGIDYIYYKNASREQLEKFPQMSFYEVKKLQVYIGIYASTNTRDLSNINPGRISLRTKVVNPISDYIVNRKDKIRRVTTAFPTSALAQDAEMSLEKYENFVFRSVNQDWVKLGKRFIKLRDKLNKVKEIRIVGTDTDIKMRVYKKSFVADCGEENLPGGEIFCAPEKYSVEGHIRFTYPALHGGVEVRNIYAEFKKGKCVKATADKNEKFLKAMLNTDEGSRYIGELGIGMNPKITKFTEDLLFDEKIGGTIHLAFGMAYKECGQPNKSALHWDIVKDLRRNGKIIADGKVIQRNGEWLI